MHTLPHFLTQLLISCLPGLLLLHYTHRFGGSSACFAYDKNLPIKSATSTTPVTIKYAADGSSLGSSTDLTAVVGLRSSCAYLVEDAGYQKYVQSTFRYTTVSHSDNDWLE